MKIDGVITMINWLQDLRYAVRQLRKSPGFTFTAALTLAMAIGANAVVFSVMNGLILRPLRTPAGETLYTIERAGDKDPNASYPDYVDLRARNRSFEDLAAYTIPQVGLDSGEGPVATWGVEATGNYFDALGIQPFLGHFFHSSDERGPNSAPFIMLSYAARTRFRPRPSIRKPPACSTCSISRPKRTAWIRSTRL